MFPREQRLNDKKLFATLFRRGDWVRGRYFSFVLLETSRGGTVGFVITKKVTKSAAKRNRTKRRIRSLFRNTIETKYPELLNKSHVAVIIHRTIEELSSSALDREMEYLFQKWQAGRISPAKGKK